MPKAATPFLLILAANLTHSPQAWTNEGPRYLFFNRAPGIALHQGNPASFTAGALSEVTDAIAAPANPSLRIGVAFTFDMLRYDLETTKQSLIRFLTASKESGVPIMVGFDGQNWWEARPDLWNWWNPEQPGYDLANRHNVEWTGWGPENAVKICWRNWGSQLRVLPAPNIASPAVWKAHEDALNTLVPLVVAWHKALPEDTKHLLGAVKVGHEASIGVNAFYYPDGNTYLERHPKDPSHDPTYGRDHKKDWAGGLPMLGYAAAWTGNIRRSGTLQKGDIAEATRRYLERLSRTVNEMGVPRNKLFTHQGGNHQPWETHLPFRPAFNDHSHPGWSLYGADPAKAAPLVRELEKTKSPWAAVEWWWGAPGKAQWREHFERTLGFMNCRFIVVQNWDCGFEFRNEAAGQAAVRAMVRAWAR